MKKYLIVICMCWLPGSFSTFVCSQPHAEISGEGIDLFGVVYVSQTVVKGGDAGPVGLLQFKGDNGIQRVPVEPPTGIFGSCAYYNGKLYVNEYDRDGRWGERKPKWRIFDAYSWKLEFEKELPADFYAITYSLSYDRTTSKIYALANFDWMETGLIEITPETGEVNRIGVLGTTLTCIGCDMNGNLYGVTKNDQSLVRINKKNADIRAVGVLTMKNGTIQEGCIDGELFYSPDGQALIFNDLTGKMYWLRASYGPDEEYFTPMYEVNPVTAEVTMPANLGKYGNHFNGAFFREPLFNAPGAVSEFGFVPGESGALSGKFRFRTPEKSYKGDDLAGELSVRIEEEGRLLAAMEGLEPDKSYESGVVELAPGNHTLMFYASGQGGRGVTIQRTVVSGYDIPAAPSNVVLVAEELTTTLTWDLPTKGYYGGTIDPENLCFTIYRYPGETVVAQGLKEAVFVEEHPGEMTTYTYRVVSFAGDRQGGNALSNPLVVGTPLKVPYEGFEDVFGFYNYYTILDCNKDGLTWNFLDTDAAVCLGGENQAADDWLVSPAFDLEPGRYKLSYKAGSFYRDYPASMKVCFGTSVRTEDLKLKLADLSGLEYESKPFEHEFDVPDPGNWHFGFHSYSPVAKSALLLENIRLIRVGSGISDLERSSVKVTAGSQGIQIFNPERTEIKVFGMDGCLIFVSSGNMIEVDLPSGVYVLYYSGKVRKVPVG